MATGLAAELVAAVLERIKADATAEGMPGKALRPAKPLSRRRLSKAEAELGFAIPAGLRDLYGRIGNGGFGPGYGLVGLSGGVEDDLGRDVVDDYRLRLEPDPAESDWFWPEGVLAICHWGCGIYTCIDCRTEEGMVLRFDPNPVDEDWSLAWGFEKPDLSAWLSAWLRGEEQFGAGTPDGTFTIQR